MCNQIKGVDEVTGEVASVDEVTGEVAKPCGIQVNTQDSSESFYEADTWDIELDGTLHVLAGGETIATYSKGWHSVMRMSR